MGYIEKKELIEKLQLDNSFSTKEIEILDSLIEKDKIREDEAVLKEWAITKLEEYGLREKFLKFCETNCLFPQWVENAKKGID
jgi:hypothetical protein